MAYLEIGVYHDIHHVPQGPGNPRRLVREDHVMVVVYDRAPSFDDTALWENDELANELASWEWSDEVVD